MGEPLLTSRAEKGTRGTPLSVGMLSTYQSAYTNAHSFLGCMYMPVSVSGAQQGIFTQSDVVIKMHEAELNLACPFPSP